MFIVLNGKRANDETLRSAILHMRKEIGNVEVRVTYEYGDVARFLSEAIHAKSQRIVIGGGDGSVNEMVDALAKLPIENRPELAILPLGTANDFATACTIPMENLSALRLAAFGTAKAVDIAKANERHFINMATAGFGAAVTAETPPELKNFLGGGAYTLTGVLKAINFTPYKGKIKTPDFESEHTGVVAAICNGRQAGGGQVLAPYALINDALLDILIISHFTLTDIPTVIEEIRYPSQDGKFVKYFKTPWIEGLSEEYIPINLDGEPYRNNHIRFEIIPSAVNLVLPHKCPLLG
jgi:lipid kinase YegS